MSDTAPADSALDLAHRVKSAVMWRSGAQIVAQMISWGVTLAVVRILDPHDFGLFAMTAVILAVMTFLNGYQFASALIQAESVEPIRIRQTLGMMILLSWGIAILQVLIAPLAAEWYGEPVVASMLRWQALIYLATPFMVVPEILLARKLDFKITAMVNFTGAIFGALVALGCALAGLGVWTLVFAPIAQFWLRAILFVAATRFAIRPSFDMRGMGSVFGWGIILLASNALWIVQSQADIFIAGRSFSPHDLGLYSEALFLTTIFVSKFVPPLNDVAFPAYSRMQGNREQLAGAFLKAAKLILLIACPLYVGLALVAEPAVALLFGEKWLSMAPMVRILAFAMPMMTLHILFAPALNALGRPEVTLRNSLFGALLMPSAYIVGVEFGGIGLAVAWLATYPILIWFTVWQARPVIGISYGGLIRALWPAIASSAAMVPPVWLALQWLPPLGVIGNVLAPAAVGALSYAGLLWLTQRRTVDELVALVARRKPPVPEPLPA